VPLSDVLPSITAWQDMRPLSWRGRPCQQFPSDMLRYAEILHQRQPPWILECGTADGGTALFLADALGSRGGRVITVDKDPRPVTIIHPRLTLLKGDAADPGIVARVTRMTAGERGLVMLDTDHMSAQVLAELDAYAPLADYLIVQDTLMGWLPQYPDNPRIALEKWLPEHPEFVQDDEPVPTNHPGGWLRRVADPAAAAADELTRLGQELGI
jgi:cephalosporin hydroxylase